MEAQSIGQVQRDFSPGDLEIWRSILKDHQEVRNDQIIELFGRGVDLLGIRPDQAPDLKVINQKLKTLTGFQGVFVDGLEEGESFFRLLSERSFPVGNFIRDKQDLSYTPAPDIVHDLYGHIPFFTDPEYSDFCQKFGEAASRFLDREDLLRQFERIFWFTIEFGLVKTPKGVRIFGAGIASSIGECAYALSGDPEVLPFDIDTVRKQEYRIDQMQKKLFVLENPEQLYSCLPELEKRVEADR